MKLTIWICTQSTKQLYFHHIAYFKKKERIEINSKCEWISYVKESCAGDILVRLSTSCWLMYTPSPPIQRLNITSNVFAMEFFAWSNAAAFAYTQVYICTVLEQEHQIRCFSNENLEDSLNCIVNSKVSMYSV